MYNTKMKNVSENKVLQMFIEKYGNNLVILKGSDIPNVKWVKKNMKNQIVLIINAKNPELPKTDLGNERTIEFCFIKDNVITWIDVQHLLTPSSIANILLGKINAAKKCKDVYLFPVDGNGYTNTNMKTYNTFIKTLIKNDYGCNVRVFRLSELIDFI